MKLRMLSDLHLAHWRDRFELEEVEHDVLICVGDVRDSVTDRIELLRRMNKRPVVFVGGNLSEALCEHSKGPDDNGLHSPRPSQVLRGRAQYASDMLTGTFVLQGRDLASHVAVQVYRPMPLHQTLLAKANIDFNTAQILLVWLDPV